MKFRITFDSVAVTYPPFKYHIPFSEIRSVELMGKFPWYTGWGLRIQGRKLLFVGKHGSSVVITKESGFFRTVALVPENPEEFRRRIEIAIEQVP